MSKETLARPSFRLGERWARSRMHWWGLRLKQIGGGRALRGRGAYLAPQEYRGKLQETAETWPQTGLEEVEAGWERQLGSTPRGWEVERRLWAWRAAGTCMAGEDPTWTELRKGSPDWGALPVTLRCHRKPANHFFYEEIQSQIGQNISYMSI